MKTNVEIVQTYARYCDHIKTANAETMLSSYKAMCNYLEEFCVDDHLKVNLKLGVIANTLVQIKKKNIFLRELSESWSYRVVKQVKNITKHLWNVDVENGVQRDSEKILFGKFCKLSNEQEDAAIQLYMWLLYSNTEIGGELMEYQIEYLKDIGNAQTDDEIASIIFKNRPNEYRALYGDREPSKENKYTEMSNEVNKILLEPSELEEALVETQRDIVRASQRLH